MTAVIIFMVLICLGVLGWYYLFPAVLAGALVVTTPIMAVLFTTLLLFCVGFFLVFLFSGLSIFIVGIVLLVWFIIAIILFPILFPLVLPLLLTFCFITYLRRRQINKKANQDK